LGEIISWPSALLGRDKSLVVATSATISRWRHNQRYDFAWSLGKTNPKNFVFRFVFLSLNRNFGFAELSRFADSFGEINLPSSQTALRFRAVARKNSNKFGFPLA